MRKLLVALMVIGLLLVVGVVEAEWTVTNVLRSWDDQQSRWENGNMEMWLDATNQPFHHHFFGPSEFNTDLITDACNPSWPDVVGTDTRYAGSALIGLYHVDTGGSLASPTGFQSTTNWKLVKCSALEPGNPTPDKKYPEAADILADCPADNGDVYYERCEILGKDTLDQTTECGALGTGNCDYEITSTFRVNLDTDCDGALDTGYDDDICLYFEAIKPPFSPPFWQGNIQARLEAKSGDKTDNFTVRGPTAVTFLSLSAMPNAQAWPAILGVVVLGAVVVGSVLMVYRRRKM
jgi:hypothetical protein